MITKFLKVLVAISFVSVGGSLALAENTSASGAAPASAASAPIQALNKAHEAAGAVEAHDDEVSKEAGTITDDEGMADEDMADEDMEMPEEDLEDAPAGAQADQ